MEAVEMAVQLVHRPRSEGTSGSVGARGRGLARRLVGGFFLVTGGVHVGIVAADPSFYGPFADAALLSLVTTAWRDVFMAAPVVWGLAVATGEIVLGVLLLRGGRWAAAGWTGVIAFHLALMLFGWGFWLWSVPVLVALVSAALRDHRAATDGARGDRSTTARGGTWEGLP